MKQPIIIFPTPSVDCETIETKTARFGDLVQRTTHLSFITGSHEFDDHVNFFNNNIRRSNSFISCVLECYNKHIALKLTPDIIYIAILIQFCTYVNTLSKKSTHQKFFETDEAPNFHFFYNSGDENDIETFDFEKMFNAFSITVQSTLKNPKLVDIFDCNFSTSTKKDKVVAKFLLAATLKDYYSYYGYPCCGIPQIEILGDQQDWELILENCKQLEQYDYGDGELINWLKLIYPIIQQFVNVHNDKDPSKNDFWSKMVRHITGGSGYDHIDGWLTAFTYFRLGCHKNYTVQLGDYTSFSLIHNDEKIVYPFVHYNLIANGNVSFNVNMSGWEKKVIKAEINAGQFFYSIRATENNHQQLVPENDWIVVSDIFENATQKMFPDSNWNKDIKCEINQDPDKTYFKNTEQVLHSLEPIYQHGHWEKFKFIDGPIDDFLHFFVSSIDTCWTSNFKTCVKCYQKGSFFVEVFQGAKYVDSFGIERPPLECCIKDCVAQPYVIPILRQWLENNYTFDRFPVFQFSKSGTSLGHIIYGSLNRPIDGTMIMCRLEIPLSKMKKLHLQNHFDHAIIDQFNKCECKCSQDSTTLSRSFALTPNTLEFSLLNIDDCKHLNLMSEEDHKKNKCWSCLASYAFEMTVSLGNDVIDKFVIISEKPSQNYQYIYQWLLNNVDFDMINLTKFNFLPSKQSKTFQFYLDNANRVKQQNPHKWHSLPIWNITTQSFADFRRALCNCDKTNVLNLDCFITDHPIFKDKCTLEWKITTKSFDHEGYHIQLPYKKIGSLTIPKDLDPLTALSSTFNFDPTQLTITNADQMLIHCRFDIPLKICEESFKFEFNK